MAKEFRKDEFFETERNPDYFVDNRPFLDGVRVFRMDSVSTQQAAIRTNRITMRSFFPGWTKTEADEIKAQLGDDVVVQSSTPAIFYFLQFNINKAPWDDVNMRRAVHLAIDRQKMIDLVVQGAGEISPWYHWAWDWIVPLEEIKTWEGFNPDTKEEDIAEAARIVSEYTGGERLKANLMCRTIDVYCDEGEIIVEDLKNIGIDVTLESFEPNAGIQKWRRGDFEMIGGQRTAMAYDDPEAYNAAFYLPGPGTTVSAGRTTISSPSGTRKSRLRTKSSAARSSARWWKSSGQNSPTCLSSNRPSSSFGGPTSKAGRYSKRPTPTAPCETSGSQSRPRTPLVSGRPAFRQPAALQFFGR